MATLQIGPAYAGEVRDIESLDYGVLLTLPVVEHTTTSFKVEVYAGDIIAVSGTGFTYDQNFRLTGGTITGISEIDNNPINNPGTPGGGLVFTVDGLNVSAAAVVALAAANNDLGANLLLFGGGDSMVGSASPDRLIGYDGNDTLSGLGGNDTLVGALGNDQIRDGAGNDLLDGGDGIDELSFVGASSGVTVDLRLTTAQTVNGGMGVDKLLNFEVLAGTQYNDTLTGTDGFNLLRGLGGDDLIDGAGGQDIATYYTAQGPVTVSLAISGPQSVGGNQGADTLVNIEGLEGSEGYNDSLTGDGASNQLVGEGGDDTLVGAGGNDTLAGLAGNDLLQGGDGFDVASYQLSTGVRVDLSIAGFQTVGGGHGADQLASIEALIGGEGNDTLLGDAGANTLIGLGGDDSLSGRAGDDLLVGGAGLDVASFSGTRASYVFDILANGALKVTDLRAGSPDGSDVITGVEQLSFSDGQFSLAQLTAPVVNSGGSGSGLITGGLGNDKLGGGAGSDTVSAGAGNDVVDGGSGGDRALGGSGNDTIDGGSGGDSLFGEGGDDRLIGDNGDDELSGGDGDDSLSGGSGGDVLWGGAGNDTLQGGASGDRFVFGQDLGADRIVDFGGGDRIQLVDGQDLVGWQQVGGNTVLTLEGGATVTLVGIVGLSNAQVDALIV